MGSSTSWPEHLAEVLGPLGGAPRPLGGGAYLVEAAGSRLVAKVGAGVLDEAEGLRLLAAVEGAPPVPEVLVAEEGLLVTSYVASVRRRRAHDEQLGHSLAALHAAGWPSYGGGSSWIGRCRVEPAEAPDAASFYRRRLGELGRRLGGDLERAVEAAGEHLDELLEAGAPGRRLRPSLLHGDLWWGNVLAGADGRSWLVDPSHHGGDREEDLAMLGLFGAVPARFRAAYEERYPLDEGVTRRRPLFELYPLLVHAVLFGGSYLAQAGERLQGLLAGAPRQRRRHGSTAAPPR